jgi:trehalose 6-phosphate phosphatase
VTVPADGAEGVTALSSRLAPLAEDPSRSVVIVDFDGSLAPIVVDPPAAAPLPGASEVLARLVGRIGRVAVVSGRPVAFLRDALAVDGLALFGHYGVERFDGEAISTAPQARRWEEAVRLAAAEAETALAGVFVERKGSLAVALHWRRHPDLEPAAISLGRRLAATHGLRLEPGRQTVELRPPLDVDKGSPVAELADGAHAALVMGDDRGDIAAFAAAGRLVEEGRLGHVVRVAVRSSETPAELLDRADLAVDGPSGALDLLEELADLLDR